MLNKAVIQYEIAVLKAKLREIAMLDLWDTCDVNALEERLEQLKAELEAFEI